MRIGTKLDKTGPKKAICCLKVPFFRSLPGVNGLRDIIGDIKVILTPESVDEILWCDHSNETSSAVLSHGTIYI